MGSPLDAQRGVPFGPRAQRFQHTQIMSIGIDESTDYVLRLMADDAKFVINQVTSYTS